MSWLDTLQPASFRGVPFQVDTIDHQAGDNVVLREYPFQDLPTVFRMGEGAEEIKFSAYVIGDDYDSQRDALRAVLTGDGVLVHPTAGSLRVFVAGKYRLTEAPTAEGGMARFDLTFVRAEPRRYPVGASNTQEEAGAAADDVAGASLDAFESDWDLQGLAGWVSDRAVERISGAIDAVWSQVAGAASGFGDFTSGLIGDYQSLRGGLDALIRTPAALAGAVSQLFALPDELTQDAARAFQSAFGSLFDLGSLLVQTDFEVSVMPPVGEGLVMYGAGNAAVLGTDSAGRQQLARLTSSSDQLFESLATAAFVRATTALELTNYDETLAVRLSLNDQCSRLLRRASAAKPSKVRPATSWHDAMLALHTSALRDLQRRSRDQVRLTTYTPQAWMPVWYISYRLFGTASYADEILAMNTHIRHPLLVPPGVPLRIVRHD